VTSPSPAAPPGTGAAQYRADYSDAESYAPLEPVHGDLASAQTHCETALRAAWPNGDELEISWRDTAVSWWQMMVRTPRMREPVSAGYSVTIVGSEFDGARDGQPPTAGTAT
jgi:hypothetical protein